MIKSQINDDLKTALLGGNKQDATMLRGLKGVILNQEIAQGKRDTGLGEDEVVRLLSSEVKKLRESADIYTRAGEAERAAKDNAEIVLIQKYLPQELSEEALARIVDEVIDMQDGGATPQNMGTVIGAVRAKAGPTSDGATIARLVKERLAQ